MMGKGGGKGKMMQQMFQMFQAMMEGGSMGGAAQHNPGAVSWKQLLHQALQKSSDYTGNTTYETNEVALDDKRAYQAAVDIDGTQYCGEPATGKKDAESNAAKAALEELFPNLLQKGNGGTGGKKRKADAFVHEVRGKSLLNDTVQTLINIKEGVHRLKTKEDVVYDVQEQGEQKYTATVTVKITEGTYSGKVCASKVLAEHAAAEVALKAIKAEAGPLLEHAATEKAEKRRAQTQERMEMFKAKKEAEKAA